MAESSTSSTENIQELSPSFGMRAVTKTIKFKFPSVRLITVHELAQWQAAPEDRTVVLVDSRPEEEYVVSHIEGAVRADYEMKNVEPLAQLCDGKLQGKPQPTLVCYCSIGYRSSALAEKLQKHYQNQTTDGSSQSSAPEVYNLEGSLFQWANERRAMVDSQGQPTPFAHPYSSIWGKLLDKTLRKDKP